MSNDSKHLSSFNEGVLILHVGHVESESCLIYQSEELCRIHIQAEIHREQKTAPYPCCVSIKERVAI